MEKATISLTFPASPLTKGTTLTQIINGVAVSGNYEGTEILEYKLYRNNNSFKNPVVEVSSVDVVGTYSFLKIPYIYGLSVTLKDEYSANYVLIDLPVIDGLGINGKLYEAE